MDKELLPSPIGTFTLANFFIHFIQLNILTSYFKAFLMESASLTAVLVHWAVILLVWNCYSAKEALEPILGA